MESITRTVARLALAFTLVMSAGVAGAQDWQLGRDYEAQCSPCHRSGGLARALTGRTPSLTAQQLYTGIRSDPIMTGFNSWTVTNQLADLAFYLANPNGPPVLAPVASLTPTTLNFGNQTQSIASAPLTATLRNTGSANLSLNNIMVGGANSAEFSRAGTCTTGGTVAPAASCTITVTFTPAAIGARSATIDIAHNAAGSPTRLTLAGNGIAATTLAPVITLTPAALDFGTVTLATTSAARTVTVSNAGNAPMAISALTIAGGNAADFAQSSTCPLTTPLAVGAQCTISVTFTPSATGNRNASLTVVSNATGANTVALRGSGAAATTAEPAVTLSATTLTFRSTAVGTTSRARRLRLTNTGTADLAIGAISVTGDFVQQNDCPASLAPRVSCTVRVGFTPAAAGPRTGALSVASNAAGSPHSVALSGNGTLGRGSTRPTGGTETGECEEDDDDDDRQECSALVSPLGTPVKKRD